MLPFIALNQSECFHSSSPISNVFLQKSRPVSNFSEPYPQIGRCRSVTCFEKLNRIGEGTYGIVCEYLIRFITDHRRSQGRKRSHAPFKIFVAYFVVLCFKRRCPKQNAVARLKSKLFGPSVIFGLARPCHWLTRISASKRFWLIRFHVPDRKII